MKKIGILYGKERSFPNAFVERINAEGIDGIHAEAVRIDKVMQAVPSGYDVIVDRISQDVPFYRAFLKNAAIAGAAVINNPFWWSADEKFFNNALAVKVGVPVPNTVLLPSKEHPEDTAEDSFSNLGFPLDWDAIFEYIGFPAFMKPFAGGGWKNVYRLNNAEEFFDRYNETGRLVMMLQEEINFTAYFRCYCIGRKYVKIMHYEPRNPHHLRYDAHHDVSDELLAKVEELVLKLNYALGYDFNTVEFAIRDGVPYAIDFCNPAPDADLNSVGRENFDWVVEHAAKYAIERAQAHQEGQYNLSWGTFMQDAIGLPQAAPAASAVPAAAPGGSKQTLLAKIGASTGEPDDLTKINGVGPKLAKTLNEIGIFTFEQVSKMGDQEYALVDELLTKFKGRGKRDDWASQAKALLEK